MTSVAAPVERRSTGTVAVVLGLAVVALAVLSVDAIADAVDHEQSIAGVAGLPTLALFLVGWMLMMVAMMLPTSTTLVAAVGRLRDDRWSAARLQSSTVAAYLAIWLAIGYLFRAGDVVVHAIVDEVGFLAARPQLVGAAVLAVAGAFQFSDVKHRCLTACRTPTSFVYRHWRGGSAFADAARIGAAYGLSCAGCCWALMLVMFAFGVMNPALMLVFGAVMAVEKNTAFGHRLSTPLGLLLLTAAPIYVAISGSTAR